MHFFSFTDRKRSHTSAKLTPWVGPLERKAAGSLHNRGMTRRTLPQFFLQEFFALMAAARPET